MSKELYYPVVDWDEYHKDNIRVVGLLKLLEEMDGNDTLKIQYTVEEAQIKEVYPKIVYLVQSLDKNYICHISSLKLMLRNLVKTGKSNYLIFHKLGLQEESITKENLLTFIDKRI